VVDHQHLGQAPADPHIWSPTRTFPEASVDRFTDATSKRSTGPDGSVTDCARMGATTATVPTAARTVTKHLFIARRKFSGLER